MVIENGEYCVYCHENKCNGKKYIGQTKLNPQDRWGPNGHRYKSSKRFYEAIQKYGWDGFYHEVIASNLIKEEADNFEKLLISKLNTTGDGGYNIQDGGAFNLDLSLGNNPRAKVVVCDDREFSCVKECSDFYGENYHTMFNWLNGEKRMPQKYVDMGLRFRDEEIEYVPQVQAHYWKVYCDGVIYESIQSCADYYNIRQNRMSRWLSGVRKMPQEFIDKGLAYVIGGDMR